jgi:hypothetical protein
MISKKARNNCPRGKTDGKRQLEAPADQIGFFWGVEGGSRWEVEQALGYPPRTGPVLESKLRPMHVIGLRCSLSRIFGGRGEQDINAVKF